MEILFSVFSYAIVRTFPSVRPSVRPSVTATSLQGIDQFCSFMAQSIAYESGTCFKEGIFFGSVLELVGGVRSSNLFVFLEINVWIKSVD